MWAFKSMWSAMLLAWAAPAVQAGAVVYVDADATGPMHNGSSWCTAYIDLQEGLAAAGGSGGAVTEIRVADGTYRPAGPNDDREATFQLLNGVALAGGYAGCGAPAPDERDIGLYETILSGDLNGDDGPDFANNDENSYHVATGSGTDETAGLDGVTITGGHANVLGEGNDDSGAGMISHFGSPTLANCTFRGNLSEVGSFYLGGGGGMYNLEGQPTLRNCTFAGNSTDQSGGGFYNEGGDPTIVNCVFSGNSARHGGGMFDEFHFQPTQPVTNCTFIGNSAADVGGGLSNFASSATFSNCLFVANTAYSAGAIFNDLADPAFVNCTIVGNTAVQGGGLVGSESFVQVTNCIVWGNSDLINGTGESAQVLFGDFSIPVINYSCIQGWTGALGGVGNIGDDPLFVNADGPDNLFGTDDDNVRLMVGSPCIDSGDNTAVPPNTTDLDGNPRMVDGIVNMGAYEGPGQHFVIDNGLVTVAEGGVATFSVALAFDPLGTVEAAVNPFAGDPDITVLTGAVLFFDSGNFSLPQTVTLAAAEDVDLMAGTTTIAVSALAFPTADLTTIESDNDPVPSVLFVNVNATEGLNIGTSWGDALIELRDALTLASTRNGVSQVWAAAGTYTPAPPNGDRTAAFRLINDVAVYGGFAGGENSVDQRDPAANETILSGDLNGDDGPDFANNGENSFHVVIGSDTDETAVLEGFTVTGGNADIFPLNHGGGMLNEAGSPTVANCRFSENAATGDQAQGGGMANYNGVPNVTNCVFVGNMVGSMGGGVANGRGGGMFNWYSDATVTNCTFIGNLVTGFGIRGGGMYNAGSRAALTDCAFVENASTGLGAIGGGMANITLGGGDPMLIRCTFSNNYTDGAGFQGGFGGGMYNYGNPMLIDCTFHGNSAEGHGGAMYNNGLFGGGSPTAINCLFSGNIAEIGGAMSNTTGSNPELVNCTLFSNSAADSGYGGGLFNTGTSNPILDNCILWANADGGGMDESAQIHNDTSSGTNDAVVNYSCVQGGWSGAGGTGIISDDPLFVDGDGPDDIPGTTDDDLRLSPGSPCIDAADNTAVPPDIADLDGDGDTTERTPFDLDGNPRSVDDPNTPDTGNGTPPIVDIGAYEFQGSDESIPTVSEWGLVSMTLLAMVLATIMLTRRSGRVGSR